MSDCFNLGEIDKSILELIKAESDISNICREYINNPNEEIANKLVEIFEIREKKALKVKKNVTIMIERMNEGKSEETIVNVDVSKNGLQIKD